MDGVVVAYASQDGEQWAPTRAKAIVGKIRRCMTLDCTKWWNTYLTSHLIFEQMVMAR